MQKELKELIGHVITILSKEGEVSFDVIGDVHRVEIAAGAIYATCAFQLADSIGSVSRLADYIVSSQKSSGAWDEYGYTEGEEKIGYEGIIPTAFSVCALVAWYRHTKDKKFFEAAKRGAEYLYTHERKGKFIKASFNKSDVINTNLCAAFALQEFSSLLDASHTLSVACKFAIRRAVLRSISSQLHNGAFSYISFGYKISFLYHAMALALLSSIHDIQLDALIGASCKKGYRYLCSILSSQGLFSWSKETLTDKRGAIWTYAWSFTCASFAHDEQRKKSLFDYITSRLGKSYFFRSDTDEREDPFFTSWVLFALSVPFSQGFSDVKLSTYLHFLFLHLKGFFLSMIYAGRIIRRRVEFVDRGPVEDF